MASDRTRIEPFFLDTDRGTRFCLLHRPPPGKAHSSVLYVHPFAEEMNKSRRMAAMQSRALAALGYMVLQIDLFGCGDSSGELRDASIPLWQADMQAAANWLHARDAMPLKVWGLRFGCLLAADWAKATNVPIDGLILWQPISTGEAHLTQFLRIGTATALLSSGSAAGVGSSLRKRLSAGEIVEVGGYEISPELARGMDALRIESSMVENARVDWFEVAGESGDGILPASRRAIGTWRNKGADIVEHLVHGHPFWTTVEITDCPQLLEATTHTLKQQWLLNSTSTR